MKTDMVTEFKRDVRMKQYVDIVVLHTKEGKAFPQKIFLKDGRCYAIDRVHGSSRMVSAKVEGFGMCYIISIGGRQTRIFDEENGFWFVEAKVE